MRKVLGLALISLAFSTSAIAGDIPGNVIPPPPPPPPVCIENCTSATTTGEEDTVIPIEVIEILLSLLTLRP